MERENRKRLMSITIEKRKNNMLQDTHPHADTQMYVILLQLRINTTVPAFLGCGVVEGTKCFEVPKKMSLFIQGFFKILLCRRITKKNYYLAESYFLLLLKLFNLLIGSELLVF